MLSDPMVHEFLYWSVTVTVPVGTAEVGPEPEAVNVYASQGVSLHEPTPRTDDGTNERVGIWTPEKTETLLPP